MVAWLLLNAALAQAPEASGDPCPPLRQAWSAHGDACARPGASRAFLAGTGAALAGAGTWWFLSGGDSYRSGDPAGQAIGIGLIAVGGSAIGALTDPRGSQTPVKDRPARATVRLQLGLGGATALDEREPVAMGLALDPTIRVSPRVQIQPHVGVTPGWFSSVDVDPRLAASEAPAEQVATFPVGRTLRRAEVAVGAEGALRIGHRRGDHRPRLELRYRPRIEVRRRTLHPNDAEREQVFRHVAWFPLTLGMRWHVSPRQRFTWFVGPRLDRIRFSEPGTTTLQPAAGRVWGPWYGEAYYQIDARLSSRATGRFNLGYLHSNLDGQSFDTGAIIGFFGPVDVSWDTRIRRNGSTYAWQATVGSLLGHGGGPYLSIGMILGGPT